MILEVVDLVLMPEDLEDLVWKLEEALYSCEKKWRGYSICASLVDSVCELVPAASCAGTVAEARIASLLLRVLRHCTTSSDRLCDQCIGHLRGGG